MAVYKKRSMVKKFVRKAKRAIGKAIKQRYYPKGKVSYGNIYKDVSMLKKMINAEKKWLELNIRGQVFGQVLGNGNGYHSNDITPIPSQGVGQNQRTGQSIKTCSWHMTAQIIQQSSAVSPTNYHIYLLKVKGDPVASPATLISERWFTNNFVGGGGSIVDLNSQLNQTNYNDSVVIYSKRFRIGPDTVSGQTGFRTINLGGKFQHHVRYEGDTNTIAQGQIVMVILADNGNCSPTVASTLSNIPNSAVNTGCTLNYAFRWYYYDN